MKKRNPPADKKNEAASTARPTLRTIAELSGYAVTTVSRALAGDRQIAAETRDRVAKIADEINYVPDRAAQRLRTGRTNVIGLILDPHDEILGFGTSLIAGLTEALSGTHYHLIVIPRFATGDGAEKVQHILRNNLADGIVFTRTEPFDPRVRLLLEHDFPFVSHGRTDFSSPHPFVDYDNEAFALTAARTLIAKRRKKLCIILPPRQFTFHQHLNYGFMSAVREAGIDYEIPADINLDSGADEIYAWICNRLNKPEPADGYICAGEVSALTIIAALLDHGWRIGEDVDIIAKQTSRLFDQVRPRIETVYEDIRAAGKAMGELLLKRIAGEIPAQWGIIHQPILSSDGGADVKTGAAPAIKVSNPGGD